MTRPSVGHWLVCQSVVVSFTLLASFAGQVRRPRLKQASQVRACSGQKLGWLVEDEISNEALMTAPPSAHSRIVPFGTLDRHFNLKPRPLSSDASAPPKASPAKGEPASAPRRARRSEDALLAARTAPYGASWIEDRTDRHHFRQCKNQGKCSWCSYIMVKEKWKEKLAMVPNMAPMSYAQLPAPTQKLAKMTWLDRKIKGDSIYLGCTACAEYFKGKASGGQWAHYQVQVAASRMRPGRLLPHAESRLHKIAVAKFLQLDAGFACP